MTDIPDTIAVGKSGSFPMPPYTSFGSFRSAISVLAEHGVPNRIDRSVWGNRFSGSVVGQVLTAHRFMRLVDGDGAPTPALSALAKAYNTENWASSLRSVLHESYGPLLDLDLEKATANQLYERFRTLYGAEGETGRKCVTFFLQAAQEAAIPVSKYLMSNVKPRTTGARRKSRLTRVAESASRQPEPPPTTLHSANMTDRLLEKFPEFDPSWPDDIKAKWFASFSELMDRTKT